MGTVKKLRVDLNEEYSKRFEIVKKWIGVQQDSEAVRFMITHFYNALKEGKLSVLKD